MGEIHYNKNVTLAQLQEKTIIEYEKEEVEKPFTYFLYKNNKGYSMIDLVLMPTVKKIRRYVR